MSNSKLDAILEFCSDNSIEIVSYGLAPNPNGFCYELCGDACRDEAMQLDKMLAALTTKQEAELRKIIFGSK